MGPVYPGKGPKKRQKAKRKFCGQQVLIGAAFLKFSPKRANLATLAGSVLIPRLLCFAFPWRRLALLLTLSWFQLSTAT